MSEVFNRIETKYVLDETVCRRLRARLGEYMVPDEYNKNHKSYPILNLYYDTPDSALIRRSVSKPLYKEKLRLRAYGVPEQNSPVYLEIKKKYRGSVNKRRCVLPLYAAYDFLDGKGMPADLTARCRQVMREISYMLSRQPLSPCLFLSYQRRAFFDGPQKALRISFDRDIVVRREFLKLEEGIFGRRLLPQGTEIMEIKTNGGMPLWLADLLAEHAVYPQGFSKYGTEFTQKKQEELCLNPYLAQTRAM
jgi:SPX domain protein involved in polyphosphate accumulation